MTTAVTMTGADFKRFHNDDATWAGGVFYDDDEIFINGKQRTDSVDVDKIDDAAKVEVRGGDVMDGDDDFVCSLPEFAQRWLDAQTHTTLTVKIEKAKLAAVRAAIEAAGGTIE